MKKKVNKSPSAAIESSKKKVPQIHLELDPVHFPVLSNRFGNNPDILLERLVRQLEGMHLEINEENLHWAAASLESDL